MRQISTLKYFILLKYKPVKIICVKTAYPVISLQINFFPAPLGHDAPPRQLFVLRYLVKVFLSIDKKCNLSTTKKGSPIKFLQ